MRSSGGRAQPVIRLPVDARGGRLHGPRRRGLIESAGPPHTGAAASTQNMGTLFTRSAMAGLAFLLAWAAPAQENRKGPEPPRATVVIPAVTVTSRTIHVAAGDSLQAAIDAARAGDRITLEPRATYKGPFRLTRKTGDAWIVIS